MKKYCNGADVNHASRRVIGHNIATPRNYCCSSATDIFEASA